MSKKKVAIGAKPVSGSAAADAWVKSQAPADKPVMKRLTIDIPEDLHRAIKSSCAMRGTKIADEVRELLVQKYGKA